MRRITMFLVVAGLAALMVTAIAVAHKKTWSASIAGLENVEGEGGEIVVGKLNSPKAKCKKFRNLKLVGRDGHVASRGQTAKTGHFTLFYDPESTPRDAYSVESNAKRLPPRTRAHKHICKALSVRVGVLGEDRGRPPKGPDKR